MKEINVLMYAIHPDPSGFIGGGFIRTYELLKRGKDHGINYFVIEPKKSFGCFNSKLNYNCFELDCDYDFYSPKSVFECMLKALERGLDIARKHTIHLVYSPVEVQPSSLLPYFTYLLTRIPWTVTVQSLPLFGHSTGIGTPINPSLGALYSHLRKSRFPLFSSISAAFYYSILYNVLRKCPRILVTSETIVKDFHSIDPLLAEKLFVISPGNAIDENKCRGGPVQARRPAARRRRIGAGCSAPETGLAGLSCSGSREGCGLRHTPRP